MKRFAIALALTVVTAAPALAAEPKLEGTFKDWSVYSRLDGNDKICYALSTPSSKSPGNVNHGDIYFMVSTWQSGAAKEQPSFLAGYPLKTTRAPKAKVGATSITMYGADNEAFIDASSDERTLVSKMRAGSTMTISAVSSRGTDTRYQFSLSGVTAALSKAKAVCR